MATLRQLSRGLQPEYDRDEYWTGEGDDREIHYTLPTGQKVTVFDGPRVNDPGNRLIEEEPEPPFGNPQYRGKHVYATNIYDTAQRWKEEGRLKDDNFTFITNTPEETAEARVKGMGDWGKVIGPPEAAARPKKQEKIASPFPGKPPSDDDLEDLREFNTFWSVYAGEKYGGQDPLTTIKPLEIRTRAEQALVDQNAQFIHDYEKYGAGQLGPESTTRYKRLMEGIKKAGDRAEAEAKEEIRRAEKDRAEALDFFKSKRQAARGQYQIIGHDEKTGLPILQNVRAPYDTKRGQGLPGVKVAPGRAGKGEDETEALMKFRVGGGSWYDARTPREFVVAGKDKYTSESIVRRLIEAGHDPAEIRRAMLAENMAEKEIEQAFSKAGARSAGPGAVRPGQPAGGKPAGGISAAPSSGSGVQRLDENRAVEYLRQAGWNGQGKPTEAQKQAARALAAWDEFK
ncbi:MAG: hypothetical protein AB1585_19185 [Thermodesulfobacteriota bacterium]